MRFNIILFIIVTFLFSCKKEPTFVIDCTKKVNDINSVSQLMNGTYNWVYSKVHVYGNPLYIETPANTGLNYKYEFNKNGTVKYYENNNLKSYDSYVIDYESKITTYPSDSATIIIIKDRQTGARKEFFRPFLCNDSAIFYNPFSSMDSRRYFKRN